jgi:hypothetical protein
VTLWSRLASFMKLHWKETNRVPQSERVTK